ncbi:MAG: RNA methyltransferase [Muribaculaceae bacterium]|nr:RNA methyltransferase [Muribaculaceae bacterium]
MELTVNMRKMVARLDKVKYRREAGLFKAEGTKCVLDTLGAFDLEFLAATSEWFGDTDVHGVSPDRMVCVSRADLERMSHMSTAPDVIAVYRIPDAGIDFSEFDRQLVLALDGVQDPGNLGTIIRCADWFGINQIVCSHDTVDVYNPKVVMATMGAISRVRVHYCDLARLLKDYAAALPVYGTFLDGENIYAADLSSDKGIVIMGNEGNGISDHVAKAVTHRLTIPAFRQEGAGSESLNVAMATAIVLSEFRRSLKI